MSPENSHLTGKIKYPIKPYDLKDDIFDGQKFDISERPRKLYNMFKNFKHIEIILTGGVYWVSFRKLFIADIKDFELTLTPGIFINSDEQVFKTYNRILRIFVPGNFIKFINKKWVLCQEREDGKEM